MVCVGGGSTPHRTPPTTHALPHATPPSPPPLTPRSQPSRRRSPSPEPPSPRSAPSRCFDDSNTSYIAYVGEIPPGLPKGSLHLLDLSRLGDILSAAVSCAVIGYMESIAIAKSLAAKHKEEIDADSSKGRRARDSIAQSLS